MIQIMKFENMYMIFVKWQYLFDRYRENTFPYSQTISMNFFRYSKFNGLRSK